MTPAMGFDTKNLRNVSKEIDKFAQKLVSVQQQALRNAGELVLLNDIDKTFISSGQLEGLDEWAEISEMTKSNRVKGRKIANPMPLIDTGNLRRSMNILRISENSVVVGTTLKYAAIHQFGGATKIGSNWVTLKARPFLRSFDKRIIKNTAKRIIAEFKDVFMEFLK